MNQQLMTAIVIFGAISIGYMVIKTGAPLWAKIGAVAVLPIPILNSR